MWKIVFGDFLEGINIFSSREKSFIFIPALGVNRKLEFQKEKERSVFVVLSVEGNL